MFKICYLLSDECIKEYLENKDSDSECWGYLWFKMDDVILGMPPPVNLYSYGFEPESVTGWEIELTYVKKLKNGETYSAIFLGANRLKISFKIVNNNVKISYFHDDDLLIEKIFHKNEIFNEIDRFVSDLHNRIGNK